MDNNDIQVEDLVHVAQAVKYLREAIGYNYGDGDDNLSVSYRKASEEVNKTVAILAEKFGELFTGFH